MSTYAILGQRVDASEAGFEEALAAAHAARHRPRCLCVEDLTDPPPEMYVARLGSSYVIKRMPFTGGLHATSCASYEPPEGWSGHGQVMGSAIQEDPVSGLTTLKLDFALSRSGPRTIEPGDGQPGGSVASDGSRLTLRGLLHYLWDEAELTHWKPGFAGRRSWGTVRGHLLRAACGKAVRGLPLAARLYVPEPFSVDQRDLINARRRAHWLRASETTGSARPLMLLVGELKEIVPARFGCKAVVKHVPDQAFLMDDGLAKRLARRFAHELSWWAATDDLHMVVAATFSLNGIGVPTIEELTLMPTTRQWLPVEHELARVLVDQLVQRGRSLRTPLRYNMPPHRELAAAVLTDIAERPIALHVHAGARPEHDMGAEPDEDQTPDEAWHWWSGDPMPPLPLPTPAPAAQPGPVATPA